MSAPVISVSELNRQARQLLEGEFPLLWVAGEISNLTRATSGHVYFTLKDETAQVRSVMFRNRAQLVGWQLANGQQVEAQARVSLYEARGDFQLGIESLRRNGQGRLYEAFARLRAQLEMEGLFADEHKRAVPEFPAVIGIVSSPKAAGLQDVIATLRRRAPHLRIVLYPTPVQGEAATPGIAAALQAAAEHRQADVLLVVRGGGSIEDLWAFNEELTARAIAACSIAVVSGIGHETDTTIADYVADQRAATPTAAAELVTARWFAGRVEIHTLEQQLVRAMRRRHQNSQQRVDTISLRLVHPATRISRMHDRLALLEQRLQRAVRQRVLDQERSIVSLRSRLLQNRPQTQARHLRLDALKQLLPAALNRYLNNQQSRLTVAAHALDHLNPERIVARGYAIVRDVQGQLVRDANTINTGDAIRLQIAHGRIDANVTKVHAEPKQSE
jgi:exodeoxyribonuclease VII large subunit